MNERKRKYYIVCGGTFAVIAPHSALCAPAFGTVGLQLMEFLPDALGAAKVVGAEVHLIMTRMALGSASPNGFQTDIMTAAGLKDLRTNDDLVKLVDHLVQDPETKCIIMAAAVCDFEPESISPGVEGNPPFGKDTYPRLNSSVDYTLKLTRSRKILSRIREGRKDIFLVGFKTTDGDDRDTQYLKGLKLLKKNSCNLVLANDVKTRLNLIVTPEQAAYGESTDRKDVIKELCGMIAHRSTLTFTRASVVNGDPVPWESPIVPASLRRVVDDCIRNGAYKPFLGSTVGHFAVKLPNGQILTSRRKTDFNRLDRVGLVRIEAKDRDTVIAHGSKPSVGGQSQRIVFTDHPDTDCIVHFHAPKKAGSRVPVRPQRHFECGSHECGKNTSQGLERFELPNGQHLYAVMLEKHGPNVVFGQDVDPEAVIAFIHEHFDLTGRTDDVTLSAERVAEAYAGF